MRIAHLGDWLLTSVVLVGSTAQPASADGMRLWWDILSQYGLPFALVVYFIWRDHLRESRMADRINHLEDVLVRTFETHLRKSTNAIEASTAAIAANSEQLARATQSLREKTG